jgi:hypothetical protein
MPPRTAKKPAPAPEPEVIEGKDYSAYIDKAPTPTQARMIDWLKGEEVGYDPSTAKTKAEAFEMGAKLVFALRMEFQRSAFNQEAIADRRAELEDAKAETQAAAPKKTRVTRAAKAKAAEEPEPEPEDDEIFEDEEEDLEEDEQEEAPAPAPKRATRTTRAKAGAAPAAPKRATRASRAKTSSAAPF